MTRCDARSVQHDPHRRTHEEDASAEDVHDVLHEQQKNTALRRCGRWDAGARTGVRPSERHYREVGVYSVELDCS